MRIVIAYLVTAAIFTVVDLVWLKSVGGAMFKARIGHMLTDTPNLPAALLFYVFYAAGLVYFAVAPALRASDWQLALVNGAVLGFISYMTFELTSLAIFKQWSVVVTMTDIAWGTALSGAAAAAAALIVRAVLPGSGS